jgi:hypothetical protein
MRLIDALDDRLLIVLILRIDCELEIIWTIDISHILDIIGIVAYIDIDGHECSQLGLDTKIHIPVTEQGDIGAHFLLGVVYFGYNVIIHELNFLI